MKARDPRALFGAFVRHSLLFYRQHKVGRLAALEEIGRRLPVAAAEPWPEGEAGRLCARGLRSVEDYWGSLRLSEAALADFERAAVLDPRSAWPPLLAGLALEMRRRYTRAIARLDEAAARSPRWEWPAMIRGVCRWYLADFRGSCRDFSRAAALAPKSELPLLFLSRAKADLRDRSLVKDLDRALALAPGDGFALSWRGRALFVTSGARSALRDLERSIRALPDYDRGHSWLGVSFVELGQPARAVTLLRRARALNPFYPTTLYPLARALGSLGRWDEAGEALKQAAAIDRQGVWVEHRISMGHPNAAALRSREDLDRYLKQRPRAAWALAWRGQTELLLQNYARALADLDAALALSPRDGWARTWRAETLRRLGRPAAAAAEFRAALRADKTLSWARAGLGACELALGRPGPALKELERSLAASRRCAEALAWRGQAKLALGRLDEAADDLAEALELRPSDGWLRRWLWRARAAAGRWTQASAELEELAAGGSRSDAEWALLAWTQARARRPHAAALARALSLNAGNALARDLREGRAPRSFARAERRASQDPSAYFDRARLAGSARRLYGAACASALRRGDARAALLSAQSRPPRREVEDLVLRAALCAQAGDRAQAEELASRALDHTLDPEFGPALALRAAVQEAAA